MTHPVDELIEEAQSEARLLALQNSNWSRMRIAEQVADEFMPPTDEYLDFVTEGHVGLAKYKRGKRVGLRSMILEMASEAVDRQREEQ